MHCSASMVRASEVASEDIEERERERRERRERREKRERERLPERHVVT